MASLKPHVSVGLLSCWLTLFCSASAPGQLQWTQRTVLTGPDSRRNVGLAWDETRQRAVLFGGRYNPNYVLNDTWEWDGMAWIQSGYGPVLQGFATVHDPTRRRVGIHGGRDQSGNNVPDYWEWDGSSWSRRALPQGNLASRAWHALAFDLRRQRLVLFGGWDGFTLLGDTWEVVGSQWVECRPAVSPAARSDMGLAFDAARARVVLFGGQGSNGALGDTWTWDGTYWTHHAVAPAPTPRTSPAMVWDAARQRIVLHGGAVQNTWVHDTWDWDGTAWSDRTPANGPVTGDWPAMTWDPMRARALLLPGGAGVQPAELWELGPVHPAGFTRYSLGCAGSVGTAALTRDNGPWLASVLRVGLEQAPPLAPAALVLGLSRAQWSGWPLPLELGFAGMPGCRLAASIELMLPMAASGTGIAVPADRTLLGLSVYLQAVVGDQPANAAGMVWSDAFAARVGER